MSQLCLPPGVSRPPLAARVQPHHQDPRRILGRLRGRHSSDGARDAAPNLSLRACEWVDRCLWSAVTGAAAAAAAAAGAGGAPGVSNVGGGVIAGARNTGTGLSPDAPQPEMVEALFRLMTEWVEQLPGPSLRWVGSTGVHAVFPEEEAFQTFLRRVAPFIPHALGALAGLLDAREVKQVRLQKSRFPYTSPCISVLFEVSLLCLSRHGELATTLMAAHK